MDVGGPEQGVCVCMSGICIVTCFLFEVKAVAVLFSKDHNFDYYVRTSLIICICVNL